MLFRSLITFDVYRTYRNPNATGKQLLKVSRSVIVGFGLGMGGLAVILLGAGLSLGFVYLAMGVLIGSAVIPIALTITWKKTSGKAAVAGTVVGLVLALIAWCGTAVSLPQYGHVVSLASLGDNYSMLYGNVVGIIAGGIICLAGSIGRKVDYDWSEIRRKITLVDAKDDSIKSEDEAALRKAFKFSLRGGGIMTLILVVAWPIPLFAAGYVFDMPFFTLWAMIAICWVSGATFLIVGLPIIEARHGIARVIKRQKAVPGQEHSGDTGV